MRFPWRPDRFTFQVAAALMFISFVALVLAFITDRIWPPLQ
jgi:hypothetical protein